LNGFFKYFIKKFINEGIRKNTMNLGALFSGGKDSTYAIYLAEKKLGHKIECLIGMISESPYSYMFHTPNINLIENQAKCLDLPIIIKKTKGEKEKELVDLERAIRKAKEKYQIEGIVVGAIASRYQYERVKNICSTLNLEVVSPLWQIDAYRYLKDFIKDGFRAIIVAVAAEGFDKDWLGKEINLETLNELKKIRDKYGINIAGEGGEYESFVCDGPIFKKRIEIIRAERIMETPHNGFLKIYELKIVDKSAAIKRGLGAWS